MAVKVTYAFDVEIERNDNEDESRRYLAYCSRLTGCRVYAGSREEALDRISKAIEIWLDHADHQLTDDVESIEDRIDSLLG